MEYTAQQLDSLRHMLGINDPYLRVPKPYRNYAAVNPGDPHYVEMAELGLVECYRKAGGIYEYDFYSCTEAGIAAALKSHRTIRVSRSKRMYSRYLSVSDARADLTFKQFLTDPAFKEIRAGA